MDPTLIRIWGPDMQRALLIYFRLHGVPNPDPGDVECLTAIGVTEIDRRDMGFRPQSFLGMASLLVPAVLDPNHILHGEIARAVQDCKDQLGAAAMAMRAGTTGPKASGSLAATVKLRATAKLPRLAKVARAHARMLKTKAVPKPSKATAKKRRPK